MYSIPVSNFISIADYVPLLYRASICGSVFAVYYCIAGMVMAGLDGNASTANYTIPGLPDRQVFNALNGIGICLFLYGITVLPEIQHILADDPKTGNTTWPMTKAATAVHLVFVPLYMLVGSIGELISSLVSTGWHFVQVPALVHLLSMRLCDGGFGDVSIDLSSVHWWQCQSLIIL